MKSLNEEIVEMKEKMRREKKWKEHTERLHTQVNSKEKKVLHLEEKLIAEKEDVEKLQGFSLSNVLATIAGNKQEKLNTYEKEVIIAKLQYQEAYKMLEELQQELADYESHITSLGDMAKDYNSLLERKEQLIHDSESIWSEELYDITDKEAELLGAVQEFDEAIEAGTIAKRALNEAGTSFDRAKGWSTFDIFGGGLITTAVKHSHLDSAKKTVHTAEKRLRQFQDELIDIQNHMKVDLEIGELLTFADYFFDGIIVNWMVHDKISQAASQIEETNQLVSQTLDQLQSDQKEMNHKLRELSLKRIKLIEKA
ncbi:hypothetical protein CR194_06260 [Salipaludibacillus keqinensis]|uniref:Uncharacterized protein n=1 Tax=Salipaludibacillus keqinensis TaxID=2045207 RepID=A0A323TM52_9BACI|nr:hypothetical protein [Salipaludibacillus keqinensis]PYZ95114.1 hypothetical protein CR194_06260 [Salipaludibacillus keqinensis]